MKTPLQNNIQNMSPHHHLQRQRLNIKSRASRQATTHSPPPLAAAAPPPLLHHCSSRIVL